MNRPHSHAVVTGASSGIGRATAVQLARAGYHVFAGVRRSADRIALRQAAQQQAAAGELTLLPLDVTSATQIAAYAELVPATMHRAELVQDPLPVLLSLISFTSRGGNTSPRQSANRP